MMRVSTLCLFLASVLGCLAQAPTQEKFRFDSAALIRDMETLSSDAYGGRKPGTDGHQKSQDYILKRFKEAGLQPQTHAFNAGQTQGTNIYVMIKGKREPNLYTVVTAHYDHLGTRGDQIFNGADDNASGTAALFALASYFKKNQPEHSLILVALDMEETGLVGAREFLAKPPVPKDQIALNVNMDMIGREDKGRLFAVGTVSYPFLKPYLQKVKATAPAKITFGFDGSAGWNDDWTSQSDHFVFHRAGIPFVYFGVEDEAQHHKHTDDPGTITKDFYIAAVDTILSSVITFDKNLGDIKKKR
jgi:Zn-dependent M28 family amino/carboxypeptidase